jgi:hypothetical protein
MITISADVLGFVLLCVGSRWGSPALFRLLCRIAVIYMAVFSLCYYFWLRSKFHAFKTHTELMHNGISAAFAFEGFWRAFANMVFLQGLIPMAVIMLLYFSVRWLTASSAPGSNYY